jgi:hypothetical protein
MAIAVLVALASLSATAQGAKNPPKTGLPKHFAGTLEYTRHSTPTPGDTTIDVHVSVAGLKLKGHPAAFGVGKKKKYGYAYTPIAGTVTARAVLVGTCNMDKTVTFPYDVGGKNLLSQWLAAYRQSKKQWRYRSYYVEFGDKGMITGEAICDGLQRERSIAPGDIFKTNITPSSSPKTLAGMRHADYGDGAFEEWHWNLTGY